MTTHTHTIYDDIEQDYARTNAEVLQAARLAAGLTQLQLADAAAALVPGLRINQNAISYAERRGPSLTMRVLLAAALGTTADEMFPHPRIRDLVGARRP